MLESAPMPATAAKSSRIAEHRYYYGVAIGLLLIVFVGFSRTYFLHQLFGNPSLPLLLHVHGAVMTLWFILYLAQVNLIETNNVALHRKLGIAGVVLSALVVILGADVSIGLARRRLLAHPTSALGPFLLGIQLFAILAVFIALMWFGIRNRRRGDYHKRYMTLAMISVLGPAIVRLPPINDSNIPAAIAVSVTLTLITIVVDSVRNRRLHPAFGWGGALTILPVFIVAPLASTHAWVNFVRTWLT